jgi:hypothetical protein
MVNVGYDTRTSGHYQKQGPHVAVAEEHQLTSGNVLN